MHTFQTIPFQIVTNVLNPVYGETDNFQHKRMKFASQTNFPLINCFSMNHTMNEIEL